MPALARFWYPLLVGIADACTQGKLRSRCWYCTLAPDIVLLKLWMGDGYIFDLIKVMLPTANSKDLHAIELCCSTLWIVIKRGMGLKEV